MRPYHQSCGPQVDPAVLARMKRLDYTLHVTFSPYALNELGQPMAVNPSPDWEPHDTARLTKRGSEWLLHEPAFHLWSLAADGQWVHVRAYPVHQGFGHREVYGLEADAARHMTPGALVARLKAIIKEREDRQKARYDEVRQDVIRENQSAIGDMLFGGKDTTRAPRVFSYAGQTSRTSSEERGRIKKSDEELGWVRPSESDYKA